MKKTSTRTKASEKRQLARGSSINKLEKEKLIHIEASARAFRTREINQLVVKNKVLKIARSISAAYPDSHIHVAFFFYRDHNSKEGCGSCNFRTIFNGSRSTFVESLSCVGTKSGHDTTEDVFSGLATTHKMLTELKRVAGPDSSWIHEDDFQGMHIEDIPTKVVKAAMPDWGSICAQEGQVYKLRKYRDLDEVLLHVEKGIHLELKKTECVQAVCDNFAEEFAHCIHNIREAKKVAFKVVSTLQVQSNTYYNMEKVLNGRGFGQSSITMQAMSMTRKPTQIHYK
ncbi:hypothetical protein GOP47_0000518 [Adiantum capillus-veneris]|uniref:Uncharacterized protein n=1 Tax=Adiantum capillus-veneris TaxID=13818 RepID=A0A9D4VE17_ADICA|nr:hypothetical protein GOP47_0000518 [Adiantum capillus-veneris]